MRDSWKETTLGSISEVIGGGTPPTAISEYWNGSIVWLTPTEITSQDGKVVSNSLRKITDSGFRNSGAQMLPKGSVILTSRASIGFVAISGIALCTNQGFQSLIPNESLVAKFLMFWIQQNRSEFESRSAGSTFKEISKSNVKSMKILLPTIPEQKRIVDLISSVDAYVEALQQQLECAKKSRNAVLHELLTTGGDDWVESNLGSIAKWSGGITPSMANLEFWTDGTIPWISSGDIATYERQGTKKCVSRKALSDSSLKLLPIGTIILVVRSGILIHSLPVAILREPACINQDIKSAQVNENVVPEFLWMYLRFMEKEILSTCRKTGTTVQSISTDALLGMTINVPPLAQQKSIIEIISTVDEIANRTERVINQAQNLRSGLLSDLLSGDHEIPASYDKLMDIA